MTYQGAIRILGTSLGLFLALATGAVAQDAPKPKPNQGRPVEVTGNVSMDSAGMADMMTPMMGQMMRSMINAVLDVAALPETAERMATFSRNYFDALMRKGFTRQEALQIVMAVGLPSMPGQR